MLLRETIQRWRARAGSCRALSQQAAELSDKKCLKGAFRAWNARLAEKQRAKWRNDMRLRMRHIREKREKRLQMRVWIKWRQSFQSVGFYNEHIAIRTIRRWKQRLVQVGQFEDAADDLLQKANERILVKCWNTWRKTNETRSAERAIVERVGLRVMNRFLNIWRKRSQVSLSLLNALSDSLR